MELYFVRHGVAAERPADGRDDASRALTEEGKEKMRHAAHGLYRLGIAPELLLSSPFARAAQTAAILATELGLAVQVAEQLAPGCNLENLTTIVAVYQTARRIMLVGHEPDFSELIARLTGGSTVDMKKGAACRVDCKQIEAGCGTLIWLLPPKVLRQLAAT